MGEAKVIVESGVSWLHDTQRAELVAREQFLLEALGTGLPYHEYIGFVGRLKECRRQQGELADLFKSFYQAEEAEDTELGELTDE